MSLKIASQSPSHSLLENVPVSDKKPKSRYTREFLLSFRDLERCKKLPNGFDSSVLSELVDTSSSSVERSRGRGEYGSTMTRFDSSSTFSKGSSGRWDTRSTGSSDRDADSQSEQDTFVPERRYGNQYRKSWQGSSGGHDGLLGKPSGFVSGTAHSTRPSGPYQLKKSSEPYQPPRPYKPSTYSRRDGIDSCNDETFGSTEHSTEDRSEEERKRRASFEMMRKEQHKELHKVLQEKQNQREKALKASGDHLLDLLQSSNNSQGAIPEKDEDINEHAARLPMSPRDGSNKPSLSRPVVPPGFASSSMGEKKLQKGSSNASTESEMKNGAIEVQYCSTAVGTKDAAGTPNLTQVWDAFLNHEDKEAGSVGIVASSSDKDSSVSILERFFGTALSKPSAPSSSFVQNENQASKAAEEIIHTSSVPESSKFAQWFVEEDAKPVEDTSSKDLLSLFGRNTDKESTQLPQTNKTEFGKVLPKNLALESIAPINEPQKPNLSTNTNPAILTCEDLEQLMLAQASSSTDNASNTGPNILGQNWQVRGESDGADANNNASHHLLSLLQTGAPAAMEEIIPEIAPSTNFEANSTDSGKNVTLEALFGAAFMNELHSMDAPVSSHRENSSEPQFLELRNNNSDNVLFQGFHEREMNIKLPEEECLFSVNDPPLNLQQNPNFLPPFTNPSKTEVALHDTSVNDLGNRMLNIGLGPDNTTSLSHLRVSDNVPLSHVGGPQDTNPTQKMRFLVPEGMMHDPIHQFHPQFDFDPAARHVMMQNVRFGGVGFGPEIDSVRRGLTRGGPVPHPMHQVHPGFVSHETAGLPNFGMHQQPNFGHGIGIRMPGPGPLEFGVNQSHPEALERILQMEMRAKSQQAGRIPGFHGGPELGTDIRYR
ncbi:chorismate synthase [Rhynchospora pubera]|uniref:Chorismate synthase n=1 Tax=Rhynchospora pubera TaxID=906938 RepID=A0AAV8EXE2_9POAL|nr:chorismate synthase [Rhynchospora pubera]